MGRKKKDPRGGARPGSGLKKGTKLVDNPKNKTMAFGITDEQKAFYDSLDELDKKEVRDAAIQKLEEKRLKAPD